LPLPFPIHSCISIAHQWLVNTRKKIKEAFLLFDKEKKGTIDQLEVPTVMRYLGAYPTEKALVQDILPEMQDEEMTSYVTFEKLEAKLLAILKSREWEPDPEDVLLQAFRTLDRDGHGYIELDRLKELLTTQGSAPFREKEYETFATFSKDFESDKVYYEDYVAIMAQDMEENS
jgi:calmodulin